MHQYADRVCWLGFSRDDFSFFFLPFQQGVAVAFFPVIGVTMTKGYGSAPLLVLGAGWRFRLVDCEKMLFMGEW